MTMFDKNKHMSCIRTNIATKTAKKQISFINASFAHLFFGV